MKVKIGVLLIAAVIASAGVGTSYAYYSNSADVGVTCNYGCSGDIGIAAVGTTDEGPNYLQSGGSMYPTSSPVDGTADPQYCPGHNEEGKNVASTNMLNGINFRCTMGIDGTSTSFYDGVKVTVDNAYPWYATSITVLIANCGCTCPVKLDEWINKTDGGNLYDFLVIHGWEIRYKQYDYQGTSFSEMVGTLKTITLEQGSYLSLRIDFHFEEEDGCGNVMPQSAGLTFNWSMAWEQSGCDINDHCNDFMGQLAKIDFFSFLKNLFFGCRD